ncbi:site-specific integrase [Chitinibacter sp. SCUT-21]|uniref:site-specific integrase n=1 Tax=Chitinibacter sp. SCUT-21 TaxID=2970891 RepID=UPI0035A63B41
MDSVPEFFPSSLVQVVRVAINLGDLPYFDGQSEIAMKSEVAEIRNVHFHRDHVVEGFPLLFCPARIIDGLEMNLFIEHRYRGRFLPPKQGGKRNLRGGVTVETLYGIANSLRGFLAWLAETNTDWREVYAVADSEKAKEWLPPYRYRTVLIERVKRESISRDTANLYLSHIRQFYEWALKTRRIERIPFTYSRVAIKKPRKGGDFDLLFSTFQDEKTLMIQTSDLTIPKKYKSKNESLGEALTPYSATELRVFFDSKYMRLENRKLWGELGLACGLRAMEVAGFPEDIVVDPALSDKTVFEVTILGKFNKERKILIPLFLMQSLWVFKNSPERLRRAAKWDLDKGSGKRRPLFLNRSGGGIKSKSITNAASKVVEEQLMVGQSFDRGFHDLRATFATSLARFMLEKHLPLGFIQYKLMALMGHENFSSTLKYINFARSITFESQMNDWVDKIFSDLNPKLSAEAKARENGLST